MQRLTQSHNQLRQIRHGRVRARVSGTSSCPRLSVFRSLKGMEVQLVDDEKGVTLASARTAELKDVKVEGKTAKVAAAHAAGELLASRAKEKGITRAVFDRGGYRYHGRVKAVAEGARAGGLSF